MTTEAMGRQAKDKITGFAGTVTGYCAYISGCAQLLVQPSVGEKGEFQESRWIDEQRLDLVGTDKIELDNGATPGFDRAAPTR